MPSKKAGRTVPRDDGLRGFVGAIAVEGVASYDGGEDQPHGGEVRQDNKIARKVAKQAYMQSEEERRLGPSSTEITDSSGSRPSAISSITNTERTSIHFPEDVTPASSEDFGSASESTLWRSKGEMDRSSMVGAISVGPRGLRGGEARMSNWAARKQQAKAEKEAENERRRSQQQRYSSGDTGSQTQQQRQYGDYGSSSLTNPTSDRSSGSEFRSLQRQRETEADDTDTERPVLPLINAGGISDQRNSLTGWRSGRTSALNTGDGGTLTKMPSLSPSISLQMREGSSFFRSESLADELPKKDDDESTTASQKQRRITKILVICLIVVICAVAAVLIFMPKKSNDVDSTATEPPTDPDDGNILTVERSTRLESLMSKLAHLSSPGANVFDDTESPQYAAAVWLADDDEASIDLSDQERLESRYALATFYFATKISALSDECNFLSALHECDWKCPLTTGVICNDDDVDLEGNDTTSNNTDSSRIVKQLIIPAVYISQQPSFIPEEIQALPLESLMVSASFLDGTLPSVIGTMTSLVHLLLLGTSIRGTLPNEIGNLTNLEELNVAVTEVSGTIPSTIGLMTSLTSLDMFELPTMEGTLPEQFGNLTNLERLNVKNGMLQGTVPSTFGSMTSLTALALQANKFTGTLPEQLSNLTNLVFLDMSDNSFTGGSLEFLCNQEGTSSTYRIDSTSDIECSCCELV